MPALTLMIVLAFGAVLAAGLAVWFTLTAPTRAAAIRKRAEAAPARDARRADVSNDVVRGAKAPRKSVPLEALASRRESEAASEPQRRTQPRPDGDPFERFLDKRGRDDF